jgi:hypothetical protein
MRTEGEGGRKGVRLFRGVTRRGEGVGLFRGRIAQREDCSEGGLLRGKAIMNDRELE